MPARSSLQPGCLLTPQERWRLRLLAHDLEAQLARTTSPDRHARLTDELASVNRERQLDRATRPRGNSRKARRRDP